MGRLGGPNDTVLAGRHRCAQKKEVNFPGLLSSLGLSLNPELRAYYRGLNNYPYYFGGLLIELWYSIPPNPILIIEALRLGRSPLHAKGRGLSRLWSLSGYPNYR